MHVVIAPDSFKGTLTARRAAEAIADGWALERPGDRLTLVPMSDGGDGLLDVVATGHDTWHQVEVAGPLGHPTEASFLVRAEDGVAIVESAQACGLALVPAPLRNPMHATTYGVGQLLDAAREGGAIRILIGLGGSATVDGGAGAIGGLGYRVLDAAGHGVKIGGGELRRVARVEPGWAADWGDLKVEVLADVTTTLVEAARVFGPQKGALPGQLPLLEEGLAHWATVLERDLAADPGLRSTSGSGAAGGLGYGLAATIGVAWRPGASAVAELVGLQDRLSDADILVVGEGQLDATSEAGKVVGALLELARSQDVEVVAVVGRAVGGITALADIEEAAPDGPGDDPAGEVAAAARRLAGRR